MRKKLSSTIVTGLVLASFAFTATPSFAYPPQPLIPGQAQPIEGPKNVTKLNQYVPPKSRVKVDVPAGTKKTVFILNGQEVVGTVDKNGYARLPLTVGPKDKLVVKFIDSKQQETAKDVEIVSAPIVLANVNFDTNSSDLTADGISILRQVAGAINKHGYINVSLTGYTDNQGDASGFDNSALSNARSVSVRDFLKPRVGKTVKFFISFKGSANPIGDNKTEAGRAANRRTEVSVS